MRCYVVHNHTSIPITFTSLSTTLRNNRSATQNQNQNQNHNQSQKKMMVSVFLALFLPCVGTSVVFIVYICLLWYATNFSGNGNDLRSPEKPVKKTGLSEAELEKLPKVCAKDLVLGTECAVCLDEIESEQQARLIPGCNHGFHVQCADTWLSKHSVCPVCRTKLDPQFFNESIEPENPC